MSKCFDGAAFERHRIARALCLLAAGLCLQPGAPAQASEYQIKASSIYNFARQAQWPARVLPENSPLVIGVLGGDEEFVRVVRETLAGKVVNGHRFEVRYARSPEDLKSCQIAYFRGTAQSMPGVLPRLAGSSVLLIGEAGNFIEQGGMIEVLFANGRVTYQINQSAIEHSGIKLENAGNPTEQRMAATEVSVEGSRAAIVVVKPGYPAVAAAMSLRGAVQLQVIVRPDGSVRQVYILGGHPILARASVDAVQQWRFEPASTETKEIIKIVFGDPL
jgi:TonB family protein